MPCVVFIGRLHADFVSGVVFSERIGTAFGVVDGLPVAQPLVLHFVGGETVAVADSRGKFAADFRFAADGDAARLVAAVGINNGGFHTGGVDMGSIEHRQSAATVRVSRCRAQVVDVIHQFGEILRQIVVGAAIRVNAVGGEVNPAGIAAARQLDDLVVIACARVIDGVHDAVGVCRIVFKRRGWVLVVVDVVVRCAFIEHEEVGIGCDGIRDV